MKPLVDYFYRFPSNHLYNMPGRCRVRLYKRKNGTHTVLLTELDVNSGESITSACAQIATDLASVRRLNTKTTRWIQHDPPNDELPHVFEEVQFTWGRHGAASEPAWQSLSDEQAETLTGESVDALNRHLGDFELQPDEGGENNGAKTERAA
jgi:hypothetical protein